MGPLRQRAALGRLGRAVKLSIPRLVRRASRPSHAPSTRLLIASLVACLLLPAMASVPASAATTAMTPGCAGANLRASPSLSGSIRASLPLGASVTVSGTVGGGAWSASCPAARSGSSWYKVTAVDGRPVSAAYGVSALYAATGVLAAMPDGTPNTADPLGSELIRLVNLDRAALGKQPYLVDARLSAIAKDAAFTCPTNTSLHLHGRAQDMASRGYFSHTVAGCYLKGTTTPYPSLTIVRSVFGYSLARSEILHWNTHTAAMSTYHIGCDINGLHCVGGTTPSPAVVAIAQRNFMSSSPHRAAELAGYQRFGCGSAIVPGTTKTYFACLFADGGSTLPGPTPSPSPSATPRPSPTPTPTPSPRPTPSPTPSPTPTPTPSPTPSASPTPSPMPSPSGTAMTPGCAGANLRAAPSLSGSIRASLPLGASVTVSGTVGGGAWSASCPAARSGSSWYKVTAVDGRPVSAAYGVSALYAATGVLVAATTPTQIGSATTFYGRGYGHGVGMSQYGALGRAQAGQDAASILAHYYTGTTVGALGSNPSLRVMLEDESATQSAPLTVYGRGGPWAIDGVATPLPADARARLYRTSAGWRLVVDAAGRTLVSTSPTSMVVFRPASAASVLQVTSMASSYNTYRGAIRALLSSTRARLVNLVSMEDYLRGVVPAEMPSGWPAQALQAQAIASRSYADYHRHSGTGSYDLYDDTRSQVYRGVLAQRASTDAAIAATAGQVVKSGSHVANALYHSTGGGATEDNQLAFVSSTGAIVAGPVSYLQGSPDRTSGGASYDAASPYATWQTVACSPYWVTRIFRADSRTDVGTVTALQLSNRGVSGRLVSVTLIGSSGTKTVSGAVFTSVFNAHRPSGTQAMLSTLIDVSPIP